MDLAWLNEFHVFREVEIQDQNLVIQVERRTDSRFPRLKSGLNRLMKMKNLEIKSWARAIRNFYQSCKNISKELIGQEVPEFNVKFEIKEEFNVKLEVKQELGVKEEEKSYDNLSKSTFETQACHDGFLQLRSFFRGSESRLFQITANENLVRMLGYNMQTFCSHILSEGLPEIFTSHDETNSQLFFKILEELSEVDAKTLFKKTSVFDACIKTKTGYVIKVKVQVQLLFSYQNDRLESDLQFNIMNYDASPLELLCEVHNKESIEESFLEAMKEREEEARSFMQTYYNQTTQLFYSNLGRICGLKELERVKN